MNSKYNEIIIRELSRLDNSTLSLGDIPKKYTSDLRLLHSYVSCIELGIDISYTDYNISDNTLKYISSMVTKFEDKDVCSHYEMEIKELYDIFKHSDYTGDEKMKYTRLLSENYKRFYSQGFSVKKCGVSNLEYCIRLVDNGINYRVVKDIEPSYYYLLTIDSGLDLEYKLEVCKICSGSIAYSIISSVPNNKYHLLKGYLDTPYIGELVFAIKYDIEFRSIDINYWTPEQLREILLAKKYNVDISIFNKDTSPKYIANIVSLNRLQEKEKQLKNLKII